MNICGLQKLAMVDYPGKLAATVFTGGCNLRCPFCHNAPLVTGTASCPSLPAEDVLAFLKTRRGLLSGVVLSGGEPLLQDDVAEFAAAVREMGFAFKLDTNGTFPEKLQELFSLGLLDYVAMDIKNCLPKYPKTVGLRDFDTEPIQKSVRLLKKSAVPFEFRTTLLREFHTAADLQAIGAWLEGAPRYFLQTFVNSGNLVGQGPMTPFTPGEMYAFQERMRPFFGEVGLRGV